MAHLVTMYSAHEVSFGTLLDGTPCIIVEPKGLLLKMGSDEPLGEVDYSEHELNPYAPAFVPAMACYLN